MTQASESPTPSAIEYVLELPEIKKALEEDDLTERRKVALILGHLPPSKGAELARRIHDVQVALVKAGYLKEARFAGYRPPPQLLHARHYILQKLDLHGRLRSVLDIVPAPTTEVETLHLRAAMLIVLLVMECGAHSCEEVSSTLETLAASGIREMNGFYYVVLPQGPSNGGLADARRLFLSPAAAMAALLTPSALLSKAASEPDELLQPLARLLGHKDLTLKDIIEAASTHLEFSEAPPHWLMYWMLNKRVLSSNLVESVFLRVNKLTAECPAEANANWAESRETDIPEDPELDDSESDRSDQIDVFTQVNSILLKPQPRDQTRRELDALEAEFDAIGNRHPGAQQLYAWILYLTGTQMATSSIRRLWTAVATRIIALVPEQHLDGLSQDDWERILSTIADSSQSASTRAITAQAMNSLASFLNMAYAAEIQHLPSGKQVSLANARVITPGEIGSITRYLRSVFTKLPPPIRKAAINLMNVGWHTGLRRQELFHLRSSDLMGSKLPLIQVRESDINTLKSISSRRDIPLNLIKTLPIRLTGFSPVELVKDGGGLLFQSSDLSDQSVVPGSAKHHALIQRIVTGIHDAMRTVTGDTEAVLHILRHSFATYSLIALLGKRLGLEALAEYFPFLREALDEEFVDAVRNLLLPPSYEGNSELEIVRDLLGHASELTTLAHYVHCLDLFRLGVLRPSWRTDPQQIGRMMGIPRSTLGRIRSLEDLAKVAARRSTMRIISAKAVPSTNREEVWEEVTALLRGLSSGMTMPKSATPEKIRQRLSALDPLGIPYQNTGLRARREQIEPLAIGFFPTNKRPSGLDELLPQGESVRSAADACQQLLTMIRAQSDRSAFLTTLAEDCRHLLQRRTTASTSTVVAYSLQELTAVRNVVSALKSDADAALRYRIRQVAEKDQLIDIDKNAAEHFFTDNTTTKRTLYVTIRFGKDGNERSDAATFIWLISSIYVLFGSARAITQ